MNQIKAESTFSSEAPLLIGSLTFIVQSMLKDLKSGDTSHVSHYENRLSQLTESYPNSFFPELLNSFKS